MTLVNLGDFERREVVWSDAEYPTCWMTPAQGEWARCRSWIASALPYTGGTHNIEDIERSISDGSLIFIPGHNMAVVLQIAAHPNFKELIVFLGGGEHGGKTLREYRERMDPFLVDFAKAADCKRLTHFCRDGSIPLGERLGYRKLCTVMIKEVA